MIGIYIHIPFCTSKCRYCDFPSYSGVSSYYEAYVEAVCRELLAYTGDTRADTVYFGGGTPSVLPTALLEKLLHTVQQVFSLAPATEITAEANPESLRRDQCEKWAALGINRVSLGVQTFHDALLQSLGRLHTAAQAYEALQAVAAAGITNISLDLMYGLPGQTLQAFKEDIQTLSRLPVTHASIYRLTVEEHTPLWHSVQAGKERVANAAEVEAMQQYLYGTMRQMGFEHYEISAYAKPGYRARHNCKYWRYEPYIGFGAAAHSFDGQTRRCNVRSLPQYIRSCTTSGRIQEETRIAAARAMEDYCFLALRMRDGIDYDDFFQRFQVSFGSQFGRTERRLYEQGLLQRTEKGCALTPLGLAYGNYVFSRFLR